MYVKRDSRGQIELVSREASPDCREYLPADAPELLGFLVEDGEGRGTARFRTSDLAFVRVLEDVIELLMDKGVISFTDLPEAAREKVMERQSLRRRFHGLALVPGSEEDGGIT